MRLEKKGVEMCASRERESREWVREEKEGAVKECE